MAYFVELQFAAKTDTGLVRPHNEDSIEISADYGLAILADGMGGYNAGEVASGIAVAIIKEALEICLMPFDWSAYDSARQLQQAVVDAVERANNSILDVAATDAQYSGMGTTVVTTLFHHDKLIVAHVGDSRLYRFRNGELAPITRDHSLLQEQIDAGLINAEQARYAPNRNLITRAVGIDRSLVVEVHEYPTKRGDVYLLCSDGLSDMLSEQEIVAILKSAPTLAAAADILIDHANANGGRDNSAVILVKVRTSKPEARWYQRIGNSLTKTFAKPVSKSR